MTDAEFRSWLKRDGSKRTVLCELDYVYESGSPSEPTTGTFRCSDRGYIDTVNGYAYPDSLAGVPEFSRSLSGERFTSYSASLGQVTLHNADGRLDNLLTLACDGSEVRFYVGDKTWPFADFRLIFSAVIKKISAPALDQVSVEIKDAGILLDKTIGGETRIGGTGPNADRYRPVNFGAVHQIPCLLADTVNLIYAYNDTGDGVYVVTDTTAMVVRDRGIPVNFTDNGDGTFTLVASPDGEITADVLVGSGTSGNHRCVSDAMFEFVGRRGGLDALGRYAGPGPTFAVRPDVDIVADHGEDYFVGINITEKRNVVDLLSELADSGLCFWAFTRLGQFTFGRLRPNYIAKLGLTPETLITDEDNKGIQVDQLEPSYYRIQAIMSRNWAPLSNPAAAIAPDDLATLARPGLYAIQDLPVATDYESAPELYNLSLVESPTLNTLLSGPFDTDDLPDLDAWMRVRKEMLLPWIRVLSITVGLEFYELELGSVVTLQMDRFGWNDGVEFQVVSVNLQLTRGVIALRLIRRHVQVPYESASVFPVPDADPPAATLPRRAFLTPIDPGVNVPPPGSPGDYRGGTVTIGGGSGVGGVGMGMSFMRPTPDPVVADGWITLEPDFNVSGYTAGYYRFSAGAAPGAKIRFRTSLSGLDKTYLSGTYTPVDTIVSYESAGNTDGGSSFFAPVIAVPANHGTFPGGLGGTALDVYADTTTGYGYDFLPFDDSGFFGSTRGNDILQYWRFTALGKQYMFYLVSSGTATGSPRAVGVTTLADLASTINGMSIPPLKQMPVTAIAWDGAEWSLSRYRNPGKAI